MGTFTPNEFHFYSSTESGFQEITADFILQKDVLYDASSFVPFFLCRRVPVSTTKDAKHPWVTQMSFI